MRRAVWYNTVTVVLITEALKLLLSSSIYIRDKSASSLGEGILKNKNMLGFYFVPAALYCLYNNLSFVSLSFFNPTSYFMFMQIRLLLTGLIYQVDCRNEIENLLHIIRGKKELKHPSIHQILFSKILSCKQWGSLLLLTIG